MGANSCAIIFLIFLAGCCLNVRAENGTCVFSLRDKTAKNPLILKHKPKIEFFYPDPYGEDTKDNRRLNEDQFGEIRLAKGEKIKVSCLDQSLEKLHLHQIVVQCTDGELVQRRNQFMNFNDLECDDFPNATVRNINEECHKNSIIIETGYKLAGTFLKVMSVCFDTREQKVVYSWYTESTAHRGETLFVPWPKYENGTAYKFNTSEMYTVPYQQKVLTKILKSKALAKKYVKNEKTNFLNKTHITWEGDYVHGSEQAIVFRYINVAPGWKTVEQGSWTQLKNFARDTLIGAKNKSCNYRIFSGTHGVATLPDKNEVEQKLYLYTDKENNNYLPVPLYIWKMIYHKKDKKGIVLVTINNPYLKSIPKGYIICEDQGEDCKAALKKIKDPTNIKKGFVFCCDAQDFSKKTNNEYLMKQLIEKNKS